MWVRGLASLPILSERMGHLRGPRPQPSCGPTGETPVPQVLSDRRRVGQACGAGVWGSACGAARGVACGVASEGCRSYNLQHG